MQSCGKAVLRCRQPISYEYRDGLFYINDPELGFIRTMEPEDFFQTIANAVECSRRHRPWLERPSAQIIYLPHAAASRGNQSSN